MLKNRLSFIKIKKQNFCYSLSVFHWKMLSSLFLPITCKITRRTITSACSIVFENLFECFSTCARYYGCTTHRFGLCDFGISFIITKTFCVVDKCSFLDGTGFLMHWFDLRTNCILINLSVERFRAFNLSAQSLILDTNALVDLVWPLWTFGQVFSLLTDFFF